MFEYYKNLGVELPLEEEKRRFVNRINLLLFNWVESLDNEEFEKIMFNLSFDLGLSFEEVRGFSSKYIEKISYITKNDFELTLQSIMSIYKIVGVIYDNPNILEFVDHSVSKTLQLSTVNFGIRWENGQFFPRGIELLDDEVISYSLKELEEYPDEKKDLMEAIRCYFSKDSQSVVNYCFKLMEGLCRKVLNNGQTLDNNVSDLVKFLELDINKNWKPIVKHIISLIHEYRHASKNRHSIKEEEANSILYLSCIIVRLILSKKHLFNPPSLK